MFETIIKQNIENYDVSKAGLQVNKEKYIDDLLQHLRSDKSLRKRARLKNWQVSILILLFECKKQEVAPGSVAACTMPEFYSEIIGCAEQKPEMIELLKKHELYVEDDGTMKKYDERMAAQAKMYDTIVDLLNRFTKFSKINDGIAIYEDTLVLSRDIMPESRNRYDEADITEEDINFCLSLGFNRLIDGFVYNTTDSYVTVLSEEDFYIKFKEYAESILNLQADDTNKQALLKKLVSSKEYFYRYLYINENFKDDPGSLTWSMDVGYIVLINGDLADQDERIFL